VAVVPGETVYFQFADEQHREINFFDDDEVMQVASRVYAELRERQRETTEEMMWTYVTDRLQAEDRNGMLCANRKNDGGSGLTNTRNSGYCSDSTARRTVTPPTWCNDRR
jgi:hypothetical protein